MRWRKDTETPYTKTGISVLNSPIQSMTRTKTQTARPMTRSGARGSIKGENMKKRIKDLTKDEELTICKKHTETCKNCPLNVSKYYNFFMCWGQMKHGEYSHKDEISNEVIEV